jgi:hypothetical protein
MMVRPGVSSSVRTNSANKPPSAKAVSTLIKYITPMRLWSSVSAHDAKPLSWVR